MNDALPTHDVRALFDALADTVFFVKDRAGRYTHCNLTLAHRLGRKSPDEVTGRCASDLFPHPLGSRYILQDRRVLCGEVLHQQLEVHLYPSRVPGWCLTFKRPLREDNEIVGLIGVSRDLGQPDNRDGCFSKLEAVAHFMHEHYADGIRITAMAALTDLSVVQLERLFRRVFGLTPQQYLRKVRIDVAMRLLDSDAPIAHISQTCGFCDQSAFSRQFKSIVGISPRDYRSLRHHLPTPANGPEAG